MHAIFSWWPSIKYQAKVQLRFNGSLYNLNAIWYNIPYCKLFSFKNVYTVLVSFYGILLIIVLVYLTCQKPWRCSLFKQNVHAMLKWLKIITHTKRLITLVKLLSYYVIVPWFLLSLYSFKVGNKFYQTI